MNSEHRAVCLRLGDEGAGRAGARVRAGSRPLVHRELDALLSHVLSDLRRVKHERYVEHFTLQQQVRRRLDLKVHEYYESIFHVSSFRFLVAYFLLWKVI